MKELRQLALKHNNQTHYYRHVGGHALIYHDYENGYLLDNVNLQYKLVPDGDDGELQHEPIK
ncbi:MAG TPA: hypothetical protein DHV48_10770 [Prolixibacteraceae bacterium]|nr:MAG: hypothetical protein A2066_00930 [Bacteroidetes bacterium GWB2_41_8]HCY41820.1 hypothetical protein [Prolixibacteraceae bacterium]